MESEECEERFAFRWSMPGYLDCGAWHVGDDPLSALQSYAASLTD